VIEGEEELGKVHGGRGMVRKEMGRRRGEGERRVGAMERWEKCEKGIRKA
jgi:hypothetical protein